MADKLTRVAVDTSVILDFLIADDRAKADRAEHLLKGHSDCYTVLLPAIVIAEIAGAPTVRGHHLPKDDREARIAKALGWIRRSNFMVAELSERTARRAAEIAVEHQLKGRTPQCSPQQSSGAAPTFTRATVTTRSATGSSASRSASPTTLHHPS